MGVTVCMCICVACILVSALLAVWVKAKAQPGSKAFHCIFSGVFLGAVAAFFPISIFDVSNSVQALLLSVYSAFQIFTIGAEGDLIVKAAENFGAVYSALLLVLYVAAPILTFGFLAFLFRNLWCSVRFFFCRNKPMYVFSELNARAAALATDLRRHHKHAAIVFTDVFDRTDETASELRQQLKSIRAIHFKKDILALNYRKHSAAKELHFVVIGEDEQDNVNLALKLIDAYRELKNAHLHVFTTNIESELLLTHTQAGAMKVRRVNHVQSLIYRLIDEDGVSLFRNARPNSEGIKIIHAVIVGLGRYGREMTKALAWYCQMDGYRLELDVFDCDPLAEERFTAMCPELMSETRNGIFEDGEAEYTIRIHCGMQTGTKSYADAIAALRRTTYAFVCLGSDEENIRAAAELRMLFERHGIDPSAPNAKAEAIRPVIQAVVYNPVATQELQGIVNFKGQPYAIDFVGDITSTYSESAVLNSRLERDALARHLEWDREDSFWRYEYNYRSSIAATIHIQARYLVGLPGADKKRHDPNDPTTQTPEEQEALRKMEHRRWNAYVRSEGYVFSGSTDKSSRSDRGKLHNYLVRYDRLSEQVKRADEYDGITDPGKLRRKEETPC